MPDAIILSRRYWRSISGRFGEGCNVCGRIFSGRGFREAAAGIVMSVEGVFSGRGFREAVAGTIMSVEGAFSEGGFLETAVRMLI